MYSGSYANKLAVNEGLEKQVSFLLSQRTRALNMDISPNFTIIFRYQATRNLPILTTFNQIQFPKN